jgi:hypothetical protein
MGPVTSTSAPDPAAAPGSLAAAASRLATLLTGADTTVSDPRDRPGSELEYVAEPVVRPLVRTSAPVACWAVDGGQALVADARCLQLLVTRAARVCFAGGACVAEDDGELRATLLGGERERAAALAALELDGLAPDAAVDVNLLRDRWEWDAVARCVAGCEPGAMVLVDGDLQPDWRIPSSFLADVLAAAAERGVVLAGVTKRSSLARGGAPLLGWLEQEADAALGSRAMWWAPVARTRTDVGGGGVQVVVARLDPDAPYAFRVDLPAWVDPGPALGALSAVSDDAAFPGYPYPLSIVDARAACPGWLRREVRDELESLLDAAGVPLEVRRRAFDDRHDLMERA